MLNIQLVAIILRLFSVWLTVWVLRTLPAWWVFSQPGVTFEQQLFTVLISVVMLMVAAGMWFFPFAIARKLMPGKSSADYPAFPAAELQQTATSLLGLWTLIDAVPNGCYTIVALSMRSAPLDGNARLILMRLFIEVVLGVWLLFGASGLWKYVARKTSGDLGG